MRLARIALVLCLAAAGAAQAGTVSVSFDTSHRFSDAGNTPWDEKANLQAIAHHLEGLGRRYLPAQQTLKIEVRDVDLAGEMRLSKRRGGIMIRIVKGGADWPKLDVRYTLESNGKVLRSADETISDMDYTHHAIDLHASDPLHAEKRMLDEWFRARFAQGGD